MTRVGIALLLIGLHVCSSVEAAAQQWPFPAPDAEQAFGPDRLSVSLGVLGGSMAYSRQRSPLVAFGLALGGGAQIGFMSSSGELTGDGSMPAFVELLSGSAFARGRIGSRTEIEGGMRVAWFYHPSTEHETIFAGVSTDLRYRIGAVRVGPRFYLGRMAEETGRSQFGFAVVPLLVTLRWSW